MRDIMMVIIVVLKEMKKGMGDILDIYIVVRKIVLMNEEGISEDSKYDNGYDYGVINEDDINGDVII